MHAVIINYSHDFNNVNSILAITIIIVCTNLLNCTILEFDLYTSIILGGLQCEVVS